MFSLFLGLLVFFLISFVTGHWLLATVIGVIVWLATRK